MASSSGEGIPLDDINQGGKSQGEDGKRTNKNKHNNKQKGTTSSNPSTDKPDETKSEASPAQSEGKSVYPETSNTETETRDAPNKAASPPSPKPAEDVEELQADQHKNEKHESSTGTSSSEPNVDMNTSQHEDLVQESVPNASDSTAESDSDDEQEGDNGASLDAGAEMQSYDRNGGSGSTKDMINDEQQKMKAEIKRLKEEQAKRENELETKIRERDSDIRSINKVIGEKELKIHRAKEKIKDRDETIAGLKATSNQKDDEIKQLNKQLEDFQVFTDKTSEKFQATVDEKNSLEIKVENLEKENKNLKFENKRIKKEAEQVEKQLKQKEKDCKTLKSQNDNQMKTIKNHLDTISKLRNEKEGTEKQMKKDYKKLKDDKEQTEKQLKKEIEDINKDRAKLNQTISKGTQQLNQYYTAYNNSVTEVSKLEGEVQKLTSENHDLRTYKNLYPELKQQISSLRKTIQDLENQKEDLMLRLSKIAGANLTYNNPNIADLSDEKRPTKLAEEFSELYDNEWTDAFEEVEADDDKSRTKFLYDVLKRASEYCTDLSTGHDAAIKRSFTTLKYDVTEPITEDSEPDKDTPNDATDSTTADKVDKQEHDEGTPKDATAAVPMDNEDGQENDNTNNDLPSDDKPQKDDKQENKEDDDFVHVDEATDAESNETTNAMNATTDSLNNDVSPSENSEAHVGKEKDEDTPRDICDDISKTEDENEGESDGNTMNGDNRNVKSKDQTAEDREEPKETTGTKDEKLLNSPDSTTIQGGDEDAQPEEASDNASGDKVKASGETEEDTKCGHAEDASSQKDGQTTQINNHEDKNDVENDDKSVDRPNNEDSLTMEGNTLTNDTKPKGEGANTDPPTNENSETVYDTNGDALGTSVDKVETNSGQHDKNDEVTDGDGKETYEDVNINSLSGENNESTTGSPREHKQPTTKTIEISKVDFNFDALNKEQLKIIMDLKKSLEVQQSEDVKSNGARIIADAMNVREESKKMMTYILKCIDICWSMHRHEPPVHINFPSHVDGEPLDKNVYRPYTKSGKHIDYVVWPSLHLHKGGPMLGKGVAQGK